MSTELLSGFGRLWSKSRLFRHTVFLWERGNGLLDGSYACAALTAVSNKPEPANEATNMEKNLLLDLKYQRVHPRADSHFREEEAASPSLSGVRRARTPETRGEISGTDAPAVRSHFSLLTEGRLRLLAASA